MKKRIVLTVFTLCILAAPWSRAAQKRNQNSATNDGAPSEQLEPLLGPCLDAILAPLEQNPKMPRVEVEKLRAIFAGGQVKAKAPAQQQIYQNAMAVCTALTTAMDDRAKAKSEAQASAMVPSVMNGSGIIKSSPIRGVDAGANAEAIRKKQADERRYADKMGKADSAFVQSGAYKLWTEKSARLRQSVMALYTRQIQLEALDERNTPPAVVSVPPERKPARGAKPAPEAKKPVETGTPAKQASYAGTWAFTNGTITFLLRDDHTGVKTKRDGGKANGTWTVEEDGDFHVQWEDHLHFKGKLSEDGQSIRSSLDDNKVLVRKP